MRIAEVTTVHPWGDPRIYAKVGLALQQAGHTVLLCAPGVPQAPPSLPAPSGGAPLPADPGLWTRLWRRPRAAETALRAFRPDLVHVHDPELLPWALWWRWRYGWRVMADVHEDLPASFAYKTYLPGWAQRLGAIVARGVLGLAWPRFDGVITATAHLADQVRALAPRVPLAVVRNTPKLELFAAAAAVPLAQRPMAAIYVGSLTAARGLVTMVEAFRRGIPGVPDARLLLVGPLHAPQATREALALGRDPADPVQHLGEVSMVEVASILGRAQIGLCLLDDTPNYRHALPTKVLEYQAAGLAVVASDLPAHRALINPGVSGVLIAPGDVDNLRYTLGALWMNPEQLAAMGAAGQRLARAHDWDVDAARLVTHCRTVAAAERSARR